MARFSLTFIFFSILLLYTISASATKDPELKQCKLQCRAQRHVDEHDKEVCIRKCEDYYREKEEREREEEPGWGGESVPLEVDPQKRLGQCREQCERYVGRGQEGQLCRFRCQQRWGEHRGEGEGSQRRWRGVEEEEEQEGGENPYVFEDQHFRTRVKTEQGRVVVLGKFTDKSRLLRGIENYRIAILEAKPNSFVVPDHWDADAIYFVTQGRGTMSMIEEDRKESFNIEKGDIIWIEAGTPIYLINRDQNEKLFVVKFLNPLNLQGDFEAFSVAGGENTESLLNAFSWEILEAAFKTSKDKLEKVFRKQGDGAIVKASREQIESLSDHRERVWPFGGESKFKSNLFSRGPSRSNNYGQLFESNAAYFRHLKDLDVMVSYANITKGSMTALMYNSRAIKISIVVRGKGHFEMACPHVSSGDSSRGSKSGPSYQKISARLRPDTVVVVPAGHPYVLVNSGDENLEVLCFEVNAEGNVRYPLAGKTNVVKHMEREAKELAFKTSSREVDEIFQNQDSDFFFPGPRRQRGGQADE